MADANVLLTDSERLLLQRALLASTMQEMNAWQNQSTYTEVRELLRKLGYDLVHESSVKAPAETRNAKT